MKKLLSFLATVSLSAGPVISLTNVISCGHSSNNGSSMPSTDISVDSSSLDLTNGDEGTIKILNIDDLDTVDVSSEDTSVCTVSLVGNVIKVKAVNDGKVNVVINAKNANNPIKVSINDSCILAQSLDTIKSMLGLVNGIIGSTKSDGDVAGAISGIIPLLSAVKDSVVPVIENLKGVDPEMFKILGSAFDQSVYSSMTYAQVLEAAQIRIANGIISMVNKDGNEDGSIVEWTEKESLDANIIKSMDNLSSVIPQLIDGSTSSLNDDMNNSIYSISEIIGGVVSIFNYISQFDYSSSLIQWSDINAIRTKSFVSTNNDVEMNITNISKFLTNSTDSEESLQNLFGILFATSDSKGGQDDILLEISLGDSSNGITYAKTGLAPILQSVIYGVFNSETIKEKIGSNVSLIQKPISNCIPKLATFLFNGWDDTNVYVNLLGQPVTLNQLLNDDGVLELIKQMGIDQEMIDMVKSVCANPLSYLYNAIQSLLPGLKSTKVSDTVSKISPDLDVNKYIGILGENGIGDVLDILSSSVGENDKISLTAISDILGGFAKSSGDETDTTVIEYMANHADEITDSKSKLWQSLGLVISEDGKTMTITDGTVVKGLALFIENDWSTTYSFINNVISKLSDVYGL